MSWSPQPYGAAMDHARRIEEQFDSSVACITLMRAWTLPMLLVLSGPAVATGQIFKWSPGAATALLLAFLALAGVNSPLIFPRSIGAQEAQRRRAVDGRPVAFWRPGCTYCIRLRIRLDRSGRQLHWVNIWCDPARRTTMRWPCRIMSPCTPPA